MIATNTDGGGKTFQLPKTGLFPAIFCRLEDLGTQTSTWEGQEKHQHKIRIVFELPTQKAVFKEGKPPEPFVVSSTYTLGLGEKHSLRRDIEGYLGRTMTEKETKGFDLNSLIGKPCMVSLKASTGRDGKDYVNISGINPLMEGMKVPPAEVEQWIWDMNAPDWGVFTKIGKYTRKKISESPEFSKLEIPPEVVPLLDPVQF